MDEKMKTKLHQVEFTENSGMIVDPPSPIARHVKWKMARTKRYGQMISTAAQEISDKIVSSFELQCWNKKHNLRRPYNSYFVVVTG